MLYALYRGLTRIGGPAIAWYLSRRRKAGKEDAARAGERRGIASCPRPPAQLVWFHAASVGESLSILSLLSRLLDRCPDLHALVTTGTVTSAAVLERRLPPRALHQYVPVDRPGWVDRFLDHWRPDLVLWVESEIWPNLLTELDRRRIPAALVNARMSERSFVRWRAVPGLARRLLRPFELVLAQTPAEADRLRALGARTVDCVGNLKFSSDPLPADDAALESLGRAIGKRPVWLAASTHAGEEEIVASVHRHLRERLPGLLTLVAPRHPPRGPAVEVVMATSGLTSSRRSDGTLPRPEDDVHILDTMGELGTFFRLAPVAFIGNTLVPQGGHNPIEAAQLGCAVVYGPSMFNFATVAAELEAAGGAQRVADGAALAAAVERLLTDPAARDAATAAALDVANRNRGTVDAVLERLAPLLQAARLEKAA